MTVDQPAPRRGFEFPRPDTRALIAGLDPIQVAVLAAAAVIALVVLVAIPNIAGLALATLGLCAAGLGVTLRVRERRLHDWLPILLQWHRTGLLTGRQWFAPLTTRRTTATTSTTGTTGTTSTTGAVLMAPPPVRQVVVLRVHRGDDPPIGIVADRQAHSWTVVVTGQGRPFPFLDPAEQERLTSLWGDILAGYATTNSPVSQITWIDDAHPETSHQLETWLDQNAFLCVDDPIVVDYRQLLTVAAPFSQHHQTSVALTIDRRRARRAIDQAGGGDTGATRLLLHEAHDLVARLHAAEIVHPAIASPAEINQHLRHAYDPKTTRQPAARPGAGNGSGGAPWPTGTQVDWGQYRTDSGVHTTYRICDWPRRIVTAEFLAPLLLANTGRRRIAIAFEPVDPRHAARAAESAHANHLADEELRQKAGWLSTARRRRDHDAILTREAELAVGHGEMRFAGYLTITAQTPETLEHDAAAIERLAGDQLIELRRCYGQQDQAFTWTLPLGRGLPRRRST